LGKLRIGRASEEAAGLPAIWNTMVYGIGEAGPIRSTEAFVKINQVTGFDCQSCAWPSPDKKRKIFEFCENGAKAVSDESTKKRIGPEFFAQHSIADLAAKSDYWLNEQGRLTSPMVRHANATHYQPITWPQAFAMIAEELNRLESPDQACFYTSGKTTNEPAFLLQLFARQFGTNNLPDCSNMCHESSGVAMVETLGVGKGAATVEDMECSDLIFIFGNNPGTNHPRMLTSLQNAKDQGAKIIVVNPLPEVSMMRVINPNPQDYPNPLELPLALLGKGQALADLYLPVRVNGDVAAIKGILKDLFERERAGTVSAIDHEFIQTYTEDFEALLADVEATSWEEIEENSGLTRNQLRVAADMYAASKKTIIAWCLGVTQHRNGVDNVSMIVNLLLVGGNIGRPGAGTVCVRGHSNVQGDRTMGVWERPPKPFLDALGKEFNFVPPQKWGYDTVETLHAMFDGDIKVFFAISGNFLSNVPDTLQCARDAALQAYRPRLDQTKPLSPDYRRASLDPALSGAERGRYAGDWQTVPYGRRFDGNYQSFSRLLSTRFTGPAKRCSHHCESGACHFRVSHHHKLAWLCGGLQPNPGCDFQGDSWFRELQPTTCQGEILLFAEWSEASHLQNEFGEGEAKRLPNPEALPQA
jgi:molybdopterin-dependent oxidoreductase alpha subunit